MKKSFSFSPKEALSLRQRVASEIRTAILRGELKSGDRIIESMVAEQMEISRGPIREALCQLEKEGLITTEPYRHTTVAHVCEEEIREVLFPARRLIEAFALKKVLDKLTEEDYNNLDKIIKEMRSGAAQNDLPTVVEKDVEFHFYLLNISGNKSLVQLWQGMTTRIRIHFYKANLDNPNLNSVVIEHEQLFEALLTKDPKLVSKVLEEHIR